ncbi:MAG: diguanylate cyclase [Betaproteobacteria bacterium]
MTKFLRTSLTARSTAAVLMIAGAVGFGFLFLAVPLIERGESARQQERLHELLDTVERTVSIACFLSDKELANEVAVGLLGNRTVSEVAISVGSAQLAFRSKTATSTTAAVAPAASLPGVLVRKVLSPFNPGDVVGEIALVPDAAEIRANVRRATWFTAALLAVQAGFVGFGVVMVVMRLVTRPISRISARLHELRADTGQKLEVPRGNETDEIGQLVRDVNSMVDYLVNTLNEGRHLLVQRDIEGMKFRAIFDHAHTGIFLIDEPGRLVSFNRACAQLFGLAEPAPKDGAFPMFIDVLGEHRDAGAALVGRALAENRAVEQDIKLGGKAGVPTRWVNVVLSPVADLRLQGVVNDITERKRAEDAALALAVTDSLTGLGNRLGFERRLEQMVYECYRDRARRFAMLMIDLDGFKQINDAFGHKAGDDVLVEVAGTLEKVVRRTDFVARLGGDEFVVLLDSTFRRDVIELIIGKILAGIGRPVAIEGGEVATIGASIGVALFDGETLTGDQLIHRADEAMYRAKDGGRNTFRFFDDPVVT